MYSLGTYFSLRQRNVIIAMVTSHHVNRNSPVNFFCKEFSLPGSVRVHVFKEFKVVYFRTE